jgi:hypothetical protein
MEKEREAIALAKKLLSSIAGLERGENPDILRTYLETALAEISGCY